MATKKLKELNTLKTRSNSGISGFKKRTVSAPRVRTINELANAKSAEATKQQELAAYGATQEDASDDRNIVEKALNLKSGQGFFGDLFEVLDRPREAIASGLNAQNPLEGAYKGFTGQTRTSGTDLLKSAGILNDDSPKWFSALAGFGADIATDPLSYSTAPFKWAGKAISKGAKAGANVVKSALSKTEKGAKLLQSIEKGYDRIADVTKTSLGLWKDKDYRGFKNEALNRRNHTSTSIENQAHTLREVKGQVDDFARRMHASPDKYTQEYKALGLQSGASKEEVAKAINDDLSRGMESARNQQLSKKQVYDRLGQPSNENGNGRFLIAGEDTEGQAQAIMKEIKADFKAANGRALRDDELTYTNGFINASPELAAFLRRQVSGIERIGERQGLAGLDGKLEMAVQSLAKSGETTLHLNDPEERRLFDLLRSKFGNKISGNVSPGRGYASVKLNATEVAEMMETDDIRELLETSRAFAGDQRKIEGLGERIEQTQQRLQAINQTADTELNQISKELNKNIDDTIEVQNQIDDVESEINDIHEEMEKNQRIIANVGGKKIYITKDNVKVEARKLFETVYNDILERIEGLNFNEQELEKMISNFSSFTEQELSMIDASGGQTAAAFIREWTESEYVGRMAINPDAPTTINSDPLQVLYHEMGHAIDAKLGNPETGMLESQRTIISDEIVMDYLQNIEKEEIYEYYDFFDQLSGYAEEEMIDMSSSLLDKVNDFVEMMDTAVGDEMESFSEFFREDEIDELQEIFTEMLTERNNGNYQTYMGEMFSDIIKQATLSEAALTSESEVISELMRKVMTGRDKTYESKLDEWIRRASEPEEESEFTFGESETQPSSVVTEANTKQLKLNTRKQPLKQQLTAQQAKVRNLNKEMRDLAKETNKISMKNARTTAKFDKRIAEAQGQEQTLREARVELTKKHGRQQSTINKIVKDTDMQLTKDSTNAEVAQEMIKQPTDRVVITANENAQKEVQRFAGEMNRYLAWNNDDFYKVKMAESVLMPINNDVQKILNNLEASKQALYESIKDISAPEGSKLADVVNVLNADGYMRHVINSDALVYKEVERLKAAGQLTAPKQRQLLQNLGQNQKFFEQNWLGSAADINDRLGIELFNTDPIESLAVMMKILPDHFEATNLFQAAFDEGLLRTVEADEATAMLDRIEELQFQGMKAREAQYQAAKEILPKEYKLIDSTTKKKLVDSFEFLKAGGAKGPELEALQAQIQTIEEGSSMIVHKGVLNQLQRYGKSMGNQDVRVILDTMKKYVVQPFKSLATLSAGFHVRNMMTNVSNAYLAGMNPATFMNHFSTATRDITKIERNILPKLQKIMSSGSKEIRTVKGQMAAIDRALTTEEKKLYNKMLEYQSKGVLGVNRYSKDLNELINGINKSENVAMDSIKKVTDGSMKIGKMSDDASKIAAYEWAKNTKKGQQVLKSHNMTKPEEFSKFVFFDYADLTNFENKYMKAIFPFYTWARKNFEFQVKNFFQNSDRYIRMNRAITHWQQYMSNDNPDNLSSWDVSEMNIPVMNNNGKITMLKVAPGFLDLTDTVQHPLNKLSPLIKAPLESFAGVNFFSGNQISTNPFSQFEQETIGDFGEIGKLLTGQDADSTKLGLLGGKVSGIGGALSGMAQGDFSPGTTLPSIFRTEDIEKNQTRNINNRIAQARAYIKELQSQGKVPDPNLIPRSGKASSTGFKQRGTKFNI